MVPNYSSLGHFFGATAGKNPRVYLDISIGSRTGGGPGGHQQTQKSFMNAQFDVESCNNHVLFHREQDPQSQNDSWQSNGLGTVVSPLHFESLRSYKLELPRWPRHHRAVPRCHSSSCGEFPGPLHWRIWCLGLSKDAAINLVHRSFGELCSAVRD